MAQTDPANTFGGNHTLQDAHEEDTLSDATEGRGRTTIYFDSIRRPGCYVCHWNGHLLRVPPDMVGIGARPLHLRKTAGPLLVTKISDDPQLPVTEARELAVRYDLPTGF